MKTTDKVNKAAAKSATKNAAAIVGKKNVISLREQRKDAKRTLKTAGIRSAVTSKMNEKEGNAPVWTKEGMKAGQRVLRSAVNLGAANKKAADSGMKTSTARKVSSKAYNATVKKIDKANKK
jgi:hypothetical protein